MCFSCQSFVVKPLFSPLTKCKYCQMQGPVKKKLIVSTADKHCHHVFETSKPNFGLDVSKTIPNLSPGADRPLVKMVKKLSLT